MQKGIFTAVRRSGQSPHSCWNRGNDSPSIIRGKFATCVRLTAPGRTYSDDCILFIRGVAVRITETASGCPVLGNFLPKGSALLQNLPSVACVHALKPRPGDTILDMCASPGNKTTHIAALMQNKVCMSNDECLHYFNN